MRVLSSRRAIATAAAAGVWLAGLGAAERVVAAVDCELDGTTAGVSITGTGERLLIAIDELGDLRVRGLPDDVGPDYPCAGAPTTTTVDRIEVVDESAENSRVRFDGLQEFAPGASAAGDEDSTFFENPNEIEVRARLGAGSGDLVEAQGEFGEAQAFRVGRDGVNWNVHATTGFIDDVDLRLTKVERLVVGATGDGGVIDGRGGAATGEPYSRPLVILGYSLNLSEFLLIGGDAGDRIRGGGGEDELVGAGGRDRLSGEKGDDLLRAKDGKRDWLIDCGQGQDEAKLDAEDPKAVSC